MKRSIALSLLLLAAACGKQPGPITQQSDIPTPPPNPPSVAYLEGTHAADALKQVRAKVGEPFRVLRISIFDHSVSVQAQDPKKPENVDEYRVTGDQLHGPTPVRLLGLTSQKVLEQNLFDPSDVAIEKIPDLVREASEKVVLEGREQSPSVTIRRKLPFEESVSIDVDYSGARKNGYLHTDRHGKNGKVEIF
jgi:hypothetical protein